MVSVSCKQTILDSEMCLNIRKAFSHTGMPCNRRFVIARWLERNFRDCSTLGGNSHSTAKRSILILCNILSHLHSSILSFGIDTSARRGNTFFLLESDLRFRSKSLSLCLETLEELASI